MIGGGSFLEDALTASTARWSCVARLLAAYAQQERPGFPFTSVGLNYGFASAPHIDKDNIGRSLIIAVGPHSGGDLWVEHEQGDKEIIWKGCKVYGFDLPVRNRLVEFEGSRLHFTRPI